MGSFDRTVVVERDYEMAVVRWCAFNAVVSFPKLAAGVSFPFDFPVEAPWGSVRGVGPPC